ncbi:MAG: SpoIIE family protein phosphatase [Acidobacteriaceae bacterium]|nr:SpoIIE family protein phosphatase [Acidobacteriaceae bacterium]MBV9678654.1 SpoIIE family protein phosphatase [Acidobacteriaceae bacterium]MBV9939471.1 SpoIIE family protein phosphatase [Acidobacteriaceae bacterium]
MELLISGPEGISRKLELSVRPVTLGRSADNELAYPEDPWLSRYHLTIECKQNEWFVKDCASRNGTYLNSATLKEPQKLKVGDRISAGHLTIEVANSHTSTEIVSFVPQEADGSLRGATIVTNLDKVLSKTIKVAHEPHETPLNTLRTVQALIRAGQELAGHQSLDELFPVILQLALSAMGSKRGVILTLEGEELIVRASKGEDFVISTAVRDRVIREKCSLVISDAQADDALKRQQSIVMHRVRSMMAVPLQTGDRVIGLIYVDNGGNVLRPFQQEDVDLLTVMANVAAIRIEHARLAEVEQKEKLMASELAQASEMQQSLLPAEAPVYEGYDIAGFNLPCRTVGGDYFDFTPYQDGRLGLLVGDVSGKGMPAAIMMSSLQARIQMLTETQPDPATAVTLLNRNLAGRFPLGKFITFFFGLLHTESGVLLYSNAGHNYPLILRADGRVEQLPGSDLILGIDPSVQYQLREISLGSGDLLALYSDGVTEARNSAGEEFGEHGLAAFLTKWKEEPCQNIIHSLAKHVRLWCENAAFHDDFTIVLVKRH